MRLWWVAVLVLMTACGGRSARDPGAGAGAGGTSSTADPELVEYVIPISPVEEGALSFNLVEDEATGELKQDGEAHLRFAVGEGYPDTMRFALGSMLVRPDWELLAPTAFALEAATPDDDGVEAMVAAPDELELKVIEPGTHHVRLDLVVEFESVAEPIELGVDVTVLAIAVAGVEWSTCSAPVYLVSGSPMGSSRLNPLDEAGIAFEPYNTAFDRGADIIVSAQAGTRIEAPAGIDSLVVTGPSQTVRLRSNYGEVSTFELIQPGEIDNLAPRLHSDQGGARGGGTSLDSGDTHAVDLTAAPYLFVFPGPHIGDTFLCGGPDETLFELRSTTPEVCPIQPDGCRVRGCLTSRYAPAIANIIAAGTCNLELDAPALNGGNGLSASFSVEIEAL